MTVPAPVLKAVEEALEERKGRPPVLRPSAPVGGGCINPSARLETKSGEAFFLKWNPSAPSDMFAAEADGLEALRKGAHGTAAVPAPWAASGADSRALHVPEVLGMGGTGTVSDPGWLLLEWIPQGSPASDYGLVLGKGLAGLHASGAGSPRGSGERRPSPPERPGPEGSPEGTVGAPSFGWHRDNFIGSLPQQNGPMDTWSDFWRDRRLEPQLRTARDRGYFGGAHAAVMDTLLERVEEAMEGTCPEGPSLLHGDLWSGNYYAGPDGGPVLIDPAVYRGAGEVDLAMMELFGSLPSGFRDGYAAVRPLDPEYERIRRDLYQLYYLLVHVNLFGGGYAASSLAAATRVLRAV